MFRKYRQKKILLTARRLLFIYTYKLNNEPKEIFLECLFQVAGVDKEEMMVEYRN